MSSKYKLPPKVSLRAARVNAGLTREEAAKRLGISKTTLQSYENGVTVPNWNMVERLENLYHYPASFIFFNTGARFKREDRQKIPRT